MVSLLYVNILKEIVVAEQIYEITTHNVSNYAIYPKHEQFILSKYNFRKNSFIFFLKPKISYTTQFSSYNFNEMLVLQSVKFLIVKNMINELKFKGK